jgi:hypothetical protein
MGEPQKRGGVPTVKTQRPLAPGAEVPPPHSLEIEQAVIGAILASAGEALAKCDLSPYEFYQERHRRIYIAIRKVHARDGGADLINVVEELRRRKELEAAGGETYIADLAIKTTTAANIRAHAGIVRDKAIRRKIRETCQRISENVAGEEVGELLGRLDELKAETRPTQAYWMGFDAVPAEVHTEYVVENLIARASLNVITGGPGHFKSSLCLCMGHAIGTGTSFLGRATMQQPVYLIDRENPLAVFASMKARLGIGHHENLQIWPLWAEAQPPPLPDPVYLSLKDCVVVIDALRRFLPPGADENASGDINDVMNFLKRLTAQGCTVILIHHAAKDAASDYRGSSDILAAVDSAFRIHRHGEGSRKLSLRCFKSRFFEETEIPFELVAHVGGGLSFEVAPDRDLEDIDAIHEAIGGRTLNQSQIFMLAQDRLGLKSKKRLIALLEKGEGSHWERTPQGNRVLYCPTTVPLVPPIKGGDRGTVISPLSQGQGTDQGRDNGKSVINQELSHCPGGAGTGETGGEKGRCPDAARCRDHETGSCRGAAGMRGQCGGPF